MATIRARRRPQPKGLYDTQLEVDYAAHLELRKRAGEIADWKAKPWRLLLAFRCTYEPDFLVVTPEGYLELHEVKGFWEDDARVKVKVAAREFPWLTFIAVQRRGKKAPWIYETIPA